MNRMNFLELLEIFIGPVPINISNISKKFILHKVVKRVNI